MQAIKEKDGKLFSIETEEKQILSGLQLRILKSISDSQKYPKEISRELKVNEQKVYYHIKQLEKSGFLKLARREERGGALAKFYALTSPSFLIRFGSYHEARRLPKPESIEPFIINGKLNAKIIVGSTEPHGPEKARSRDVSFAVDLALFIGTFLTEAKPSVIEDKDVHQQDLDSNLIIVGGPVTNKVTKLVNSKLPVRFDAKKNIATKKKIYKQDECGFIVKTENPFHPGKKIIVMAGKRYSGTKAAVLAFMNCFDEIKKKSFTIVEGLDNDGDGEIDAVRILE